LEDESKYNICWLLDIKGCTLAGSSWAALEETMTKRLLVATHNEGKIRELAALLSDVDVEWIGLNDAGVVTEVEETGDTFEENAVLKARSYATATGLLTLADDSGLQVDALHGQPGVTTARYGGPGLTPVQRYQRLLRELEGVPWNDRTAEFVAVIAVATGDGRLLGTSEGICRGMITTKPVGEGGFGYDPVFYLPEQGQTMAELDASEKQRLSHRGKAIRAIKPLLHQFLLADSQE
jgi:XTP/dITP diphosphohydrolase